jgi:hypothetical protein
MTRVRQGDVLGNPWGVTGVVDRDLSGQASGPVVLGAGDVAAALVGGAVAWECIFSPTTDMTAQQAVSSVICLCEATMTAGSLTLQYEIGRWFIRLGGVAQLEVLDPEDGAGGTYRNNLSQSGLAGDYTRVVWGYWPDRNLLFMQVVNNGVATFLATNRAGVVGANPAAVAPLATLGSCSAITLGSRIDTTLSLGAQWKRFRAFSPASLSGNPPETILIIGDSIESALSYSTNASVCAATSSHVYTPAQAAGFASPKIRNQAIGGATIVTQTATFSANAALGLYQDVRCVGIGIGANDANASSTTMIADYQTLVSTVKAALPGAKIVPRLVTPCKSWLGATKFAKVAALNTALQNGTITGLDYVVAAHYAQLSDGSDNLAGTYDSGDGVHPKNNGRALIGAAWAGGFAAVSAL